MKKFILIFVMSITLLLSSCSLFNYDDILKKGYDNLTLEETIVSRDFELPQTVSAGFLPLQVKWESSSSLITIDGNMAKVDFISNKDQDTNVTLIATISLLTSSTTKEFVVTVPKYDLGEISTTTANFGNRLDLDGPLTEGCLPSIGNPKVLVVPVNLDSNNKTNALLNDINMAFNGTSEETGFESVKSYYQKSSYGKLNIEFNVIDEWFTPKHNKTFYDNYYDSKSSADGSTLLLQEALTYYDSKINYTDYDTNDDGYIDSVWLIYNCDVNFSDSSSVYWAYVYWDYSETLYDGKDVYYYAMGGTDFMHPTKTEAGTYDPSGIKVDAHTFIHETGHLLGLDDYYDYVEYRGADGGLYGADMMDGNIGDHGAINKLLLGWIEPKVVAGTGAITLELSSFTKTGDCVIVADRKLTSIYDTYYIIEFYTNDGLNSFVKPIDGYGIRITRINAEKNIIDGKVELNNGDYQCGFKYDNSDEEQLFVDLIYNSEVEYKGYSLDGKVLFKEKEELDRKDIFFELVVNSCNEISASITISIL